MAEIEFQDIEFIEEKDRIRVNFLKIFYFHFTREELNDIAPFTIAPHKITFDCSDKRANNKFYNLLEKGFLRMKNSINGRKVIYIHRNSGIPIIGSNAFGIVDRNTSCIEVKPITGCNLDCIFCSVDEGPKGKKTADIVVEEEYLADEFRKIAELKECDIEAHINANGEPLMYSRIVDLIKDMRAIPNVKTISIDTNATMLTKELALQMKEAGLSRFNISISGINPGMFSKMSGSSVNESHIKEIAEYCAKIADVIIAPVWVPGINDSEIDAIIKFAENIKNPNQKTPFVGIQNFLSYPHGRNPAKAIEMDEFREKLAALEKKHGVKLILSREDFGITAAKKIPKPFKKGNSIEAEIICEGRFPGERIAVSGDRNMTILGCSKTSGKTRVKIVRSKHNIFLGKTG
jgi:uncharacterized Fe-S cluster-containing radical SAM superfamily enzyme